LLLKPENLLLSSKEPDAVVKLADFGFAKEVANDYSLSAILGTPAYMGKRTSLSFLLSLYSLSLHYYFVSSSL
jgi:serine/threonine protein kinase